MPPHNCTPALVQAVMANGLGSLALSQSVKVLDVLDDLKLNFKKLGVLPKYYLMYPQYHAIINQIISLKSRVDNFVNHGDKTPFLAIVKDLLFIDVNEVFADERIVRHALSTAEETYVKAIQSTRERRAMVAISNNFEFI